MMAETELDLALTRLREHGIRVTPQRRAVLEYLISHHTHPQVETIYRDLKRADDSIAMATVYNTLRRLVDDGLVLELDNGSGAARYDYFGHPHYHVICDQCGRIDDVADPRFATAVKQIDALTREKTGYLITRTDVEVHGTCPACQKRAAKSTPPAGPKSAKLRE